MEEGRRGGKREEKEKERRGEERRGKERERGKDLEKECGILWILAGSANNGYALGQHDLVADAGVQVPAAEKTGLRRMGVNPAADGQAGAVAVSGVDIVEQGHVALLGDLARVAGGDLGGDDQAVDEEGVADQGAGQDAASLEVAACVGRGEGKKGLAQGEGQKQGAEGLAGFSKGRGLEGIVCRGEVGRCLLLRGFTVGLWWEGWSSVGRGELGGDGWW